MKIISGQGEINETSIFVRLLKKFWLRYRFFKLWRNEIYRNSQTYKMIQGLWNKIKICFRHSFLGKITEIRKEENNIVLNGSIVVRYSVNSYKKFRPKAAFYFKTSIISGSLDELIKGLYFSPIKNLSIIMAAAILTNIIFSIILKREIGLLGWIIRGLLLFIGLGGLFCNITWQDLKKASYFLKRIDNPRKF